VVEEEEESSEIISISSTLLRLDRNLPGPIRFQVKVSFR
jgi:hypothetical protein